MTVRSRILRGFAARGAGQAVVILIRLSEIPLMFHFWGADLYGEWLMLIAIPAYLTVSDFGFGGVTARHMSMLVAAGRKEEALGSFQSSHLLITASSLVIGGLLVFGIAGAGKLDLVSLSLIPSSSVDAITALFAAKIVFTLQAQLSFAGLQCEGKYPLGMLLRALMDLFEFICLAAVVVAGASPVGAAAAASGAVALGSIGARAVLWREVPWITFGWQNATLSHVNELWRPSLTSMIFPLGQALSIQGPRLAIGVLVGPVAVAAFVAHRQLVRFATIVLALGAPIEAELSMRRGRGDDASYRFLAFRVSALLIWLSLAAMGIVASVGVALFAIWTSRRLEVHHALLAILAAATFFEAVWRAALLPANAVNRHMRAALGYFLVSVFILVPALYVMTSLHGLAGAAFALLFAEVAMLIWTARESMRLLAVGPVTWLAGTFAPPFWVLHEGRSFLRRLRDTRATSRP